MYDLHCNGVTRFWRNGGQIGDLGRAAMNWQADLRGHSPIFALASGLSMAALIGHDHTHFAQNGAHAAGDQQTALLY
jgi:hypothetical protein